MRFWLLAQLSLERPLLSRSQLVQVHLATPQQSPQRESPRLEPPHVGQNARRQFRSGKRSTNSCAASTTKHAPYLPYEHHPLQHHPAACCGTSAGSGSAASASCSSSRCGSSNRSTFLPADLAAAACPAEPSSADLSHSATCSDAVQLHWRCADRRSANTRPSSRSGGRTHYRVSHWCGADRRGISWRPAHTGKSKASPLAARAVGVADNRCIGRA